MGFPRRAYTGMMAATLALLCCSAGVHAQTTEFIAGPDIHVQKPADHPNLSSTSEVTIPGPLRSFLRMAGISQKASTEDIVPLLARNVYVHGYIGWSDSGTPTEFLILLRRYVSQARELAALAGSSGIIRVSNCDQVGPLLRVLGYRLRQTCGQKGASLVTAEPERAFLTIDSGFPLPALEEALQHGTAFTYPFPSSQVPVLFTEAEWTALTRSGGGQKPDLLDTILQHPQIARLYWALSRNDADTRVALKRTIGLEKLLPVAAILDFYGSQICIRSGRVEVPGGRDAEAGWKELVGASPAAPQEFVHKLLSKDNGWLAVYFDSLSRVSEEQQRHFADPHRLQKLYAAFRGPSVSTDAARSAFRRGSSLLILLTRLQWAPDGEPTVPGGMALWQEMLTQKRNPKLVRQWGKRLNHNSRPEELLQAMFAFCRENPDESPVQMYLLFSELQASRTPGRQLSANALRQLARRFGEYSDQYLVFSEFPQLDDASVTSFITVADAVNRIPNHTLRGNAMGMFQANLGLWRILARQQQIPAGKLNESWRQAIAPFAHLTTSDQLFDAGTSSLAAVLVAASGKANLSEDEIIGLLAGPRPRDGEAQLVHEEIAKEMRAVMDGQRLVSLDTLLDLGRGLREMAHGGQLQNSLAPLASELREFQMPRAMFTSSERLEWASGIYNNSHTDAQMKTDLSKVLRGSASPGQLEQARGQLAPFLRDTLVGLNYAYYEPPSAQLLRTNSLVVRSHDFAGETVVGVEGLWHTPQLFGQGSPAGGGAHLVGSLADLPYVLSEAEQDFIAPENVQALIWRDTVPVLLSNAIVPRWWNVSRNELHAVHLYQVAGEELLQGATSNEQLRHRVIAILSDRMVPARSEWLQEALSDGRIKGAMAGVTPADTFYLTAEFRRRYPQDGSAWGPAGKELDDLFRQYPAELSWQRLSQDFGVPHPILALSDARELLNVKPFPAFSGYSSRLLAECWDSNNLYWARLADEMGYPPVLLNRLVPELTRRMVAKIFASDFEDWPALLRAMRETGDDLRNGKIAIGPTATAATAQISK